MVEQWEPTLAAQRTLESADDAPLEVVFLPGLLCNEKLWSAQLDGLSDIARTTVARLDQANSASGLASSVLEQSPRGEFVLVGMSMGGYVAFEILRQQPERVRSLVLISTSARPDTPEATEARREQMRLSDRDLDLVIEQLLPKLLHESHLADADSAGVMRDMAKEMGADVFKRQQEAIIGRPDSRPHLAEIACPTLIVCGRDDKVTPVGVHSEMADLIPGAQLSILEDCGHLAPLEQATAVTRELRNWLQGKGNNQAQREA